MKIYIFMIDYVKKKLISSRGKILIEPQSWPSKSIVPEYKLEYLCLSLLSSKYRGSPTSTVSTSTNSTSTNFQKALLKFSLYGFA